jgi:cyclase
MHRFVLAAVAVVTVFAAPPVAAQPDLSGVEFRTVAVAPGLTMLSGAGGNLGLSAGVDGAFLVDDELAPLTPKLRAAVKAVTDRPLRFVLNTHWHMDHTGGNKDLGEAGALIVAHDNVRTRLSTEQFIARIGQKVPAAPPIALPVVTFDSGVTFFLNGDEIQVRHVPHAHTDGDALVVFKKSNAVHAGDLFFNGFYPFIDLGSGGSFLGMIEAADRLLALADEKTKIIPGHGPLADKPAVQAYRDMLVAVRDAVDPLIKAGKTKAQVVTARPTAKLDEKWGKGFMKPEAFVEIVYESLTSKK